MRDTSTAYRVYPPLRACIRWGLTLFFWVALIVSALPFAVRLWRGQPFPKDWLAHTGTFLGLVIGIGVTIGLGIYAICRIWGATFTQGTLRATTVWGRMVEVPLSTVTDVTPGSVQGLPVLIVKSGASKALLYIYTLGLDRDSVRVHLSSLAGPDHLLTKAFG
jgi:hypothetical protein